MIGRATYETEHIKVEYSADMVKSDYGVKGSPVWYDPEVIKIESVEIFGVGHHLFQLHDRVIDALIGLADNLEFEVCE